MPLFPRALFISAVLIGGLAAQTPEESPRPGLQDLTAGRSGQAVQKLESALQQHPDDGPILLALAEAYRLAGRPQDAAAQIESVVALAASQPVLLRGLSSYFENSGDPAKAAEFEAAYARVFPGDVSGFGRAAALYLDAGAFPRAVEFAESGLERQNLAPLYEILGKARTSLGQIDLAEQAFRSAIELQPYDEDARYNLAYLFLQAQRFEGALAAFDDARAIFDKSARIELGAGTAYYGLRRFNDAADAFLRASRLAPAAPQPHYFMGRMIEHTPDRIGEILERQRIFAELQPANYLGPFLFAQALLASPPPAAGEESPQQAETLLRRSIDLRDDFWEAHFELGQMLDRRRRYEEALPSLQRAVELNPNSSKPLYRLARVYARLGMSGEAAAARAKHEKLVEAERRAMAGGAGERDEPTAIMNSPQGKSP